jgi:hypothetical protein
MNLRVIGTRIALIAASIDVTPAVAQATNPNAKSFWEVLPGLLWPVLAICLFLYLRTELKELVLSVVVRLKSGGALKFGSIVLAEIPAAVREGESALPSASWDGVSLKKADARLYNLWAGYSKKSRSAMLVHRYFPSRQPGQIYDVLLYFVERTAGALQRITRVEYYFGPNWQDLIYPSSDRSKRFVIKVSAYDRFVCVAKLYFDDNETATVYRYVDFEMGPLPSLSTDPPKSKEVAAPALPDREQSIE